MCSPVLSNHGCHPCPHPRRPHSGRLQQFYQTDATKSLGHSTRRRTKSRALSRYRTSFAPSARAAKDSLPYPGQTHAAAQGVFHQQSEACDNRPRSIPSRHYHHVIMFLWILSLYPSFEGTGVCQGGLVSYKSSYKRTISPFLWPSVGEAALITFCGQATTNRIGCMRPARAPR